MIRLMLARMRVWIECPACGLHQKFDREVVLPFEDLNPLLERTEAVCDRCYGLAMMCFERRPTRLH